MTRHENVDQLALDVAQAIAVLPPASAFAGGDVQRTATIQVMIRDVFSKRIEVLESCRDFWYTQYVSASQRTEAAIHKIVTDALVQDFHNDPDCERLLRKREAQIISALKAYFLAQGSEVGRTSIPCTIAAVC